MYLALGLNGSCFETRLASISTSYWRSNARDALLIQEFELFQESRFLLSSSLAVETARFWIQDGICLRNLENKRP